MKKLSLYSLMMFGLLSLTSCEAVETIFKAGMWWGIILVVGVIGIILWLFSRGKKFLKIFYGQSRLRYYFSSETF